MRVDVLMCANAHNLASEVNMFIQNKNVVSINFLNCSHTNGYVAFITWTEEKHA